MLYRLHFDIVLAKYGLAFLQGALLTMQIAVLSMAGGTIIGTGSALARLSKNRFLRILSSAYVEAFRDTPVLVQLFIVYFVLPDFGVSLEPYAAALITLTINAGAYCTEDIRAGIQSVSKEQIESAHSLGMGNWLTFRHIVFPLALKTVYPPLTNRFILVLLGSSITAAIAVQELTHQAMVAGSLSWRSFETFVIAGIIYLIIVQILTRIFRLGKRML